MIAILLVIAAGQIKTRLVDVQASPLSEVPSAAPTPPGFSLVTRTVDGDTFVADVNGVEEKVRMVGIDTPEAVDPRKLVQCFAHEASARLHELINGQPVRLVSDAKSADRDRYNRLLRYVYAQDGTLVNAEMINEGYARAYTKFKFEKPVEFLKLQTAAHAAGRGLWATATCNGGR